VRAGADLYRRVLVWHGAGTMLTQGVYDQLGRVCAAAGLPGTETQLVGGLDDLEESAVLADLWALSRGNLGPATMIERHGFHGPDEGELSATVWREQPALLQSLIASFATMADDEAPERKREHSRAAAQRAGERLADAAGATGRLRARALIALVRRLMPLREVGRGGLVRALDGTRAAARRLGEQHVSAETLDDREDVFFLTLDELCAGVLPADARELVAERRARHATYLQTTLPEDWRGDPEPRGHARGNGSATTTITGAAASPGVVEGVARVVTSAEHGDALVAGEVLVCHTTDPGWAALMHIAAALVIDVGGPLSHGAIVARELGVPCVIGTQHGTANIRTGDRVAVDGTTGRVRVLERSTP
jgi:pyruvate,water dikinase